MFNKMRILLRPCRQDHIYDMEGELGLTDADNIIFALFPDDSGAWYAQASAEINLLLQATCAQNTICDCVATFNVILLITQSPVCSHAIHWC